MDIHNFKFSSSHISKGKKIGKINIIIIFYLIPMSKVLSFQQVIKIKLNEFFKISFEILTDLKFYFVLQRYFILMFNFQQLSEM